MSVSVAFARAGLLGNPSDGYGGKAIACPVRNFSARVSLEPHGRFKITAGPTTLDFPDLYAALDAPAAPAVEGLQHLILAAVRRLAHVVGRDRVPNDPMEIKGSTTIPRQVGLAGSSAMIIATLRALSEGWSFPVSKFDMAEMALATEVEDLGIAAGAMDRVVQSYEQVMAMELAPPRSEAGYTAIDPSTLPAMRIVWDPQGGASSTIAHGEFKSRWERGEREVLETISELRSVVNRGVDALASGDDAMFADLVDFNFDLRCRVFSVGEPDRAMVAIARRSGAAAKLCGSGGAVLVVPRPGTDLSALEEDFETGGFEVCTPEIV